MSHTICGIDMGAFSVKLVFVEAGFRVTTLRGLVETAVPSGDAPLLERQAEAVREALSQMREATPYLALPGDALSVRVLELPFSDARKIDQVVGYELEGQIVHALEDVVFDHLIARSRGDGSTVLAAAARREDVAAFVAALEAQGTHPRALYAAPVVYRTLLPAAPRADGESEPPCQAIVDIGHLRTNICFVREGETLYARTIPRGGLHLTNAIAQAFGADHDRAEQAKRGEACILAQPSSAQASSEDPGRVPAPPRDGLRSAQPSSAHAHSALAVKLDAVLREALAPCIRELRQTMASFRATARIEPGALLVTGGTGRLKGLLPYLEAELGMPARFLAVRPVLARGGRPDEEGADFEEAAAESESHALASAVALAAARGSKEIDLRRGPFVYRASFSALRQRAWHLAGLAATLLLAASLDVGAKLSNLGDERKELDKQLKTATQELFGKPREDAAAVTELLRKGFRDELAPLPKATAFDLLDQISRKVPSADRVKLDVTELDIRPKKTFTKGTADSAAAVDEIAGKLKEIECFDEVTKGSVTEVSGGAKQFTLTVASKCP
jgi:general secretion pathway protein L